MQRYKYCFRGPPTPRKPYVIIFYRKNLYLCLTDGKRMPTEGEPKAGMKGILETIEVCEADHWFGSINTGINRIVPLCNHLNLINDLRMGCTFMPWMISKEKDHGRRREILEVVTLRGL